jgi:uncharacterized protein (TIGR03437 family)
VTAGAALGSVSIQAAYNTFSTSVSLTIISRGPVLTSMSFYSAAADPTNSANPKLGLVPCGLGSMVGSSLASSLSGPVFGNPSGGSLPLSLAGVSMTINGTPAPMYAAAPLSNGTQVVYFQSPCELVQGTATASVTVNGITVNVAGIQVYATAPGIFITTGANGKKYGTVIRGVDGSILSPTNLARRGETYYMVVTNLGETNPPVATNAVGNGVQGIPLTQVVVGVNNAGVPVVSALYISPGVYYIGFQIPSNTPTGSDLPLALAVNGVFDGQNLLLPGVQ